ncbi:ATP-dependent DNA helicase pif1 [Gigaspora margarita]|uniref:ATP-dependent DNA helicase pif1 n=1 Tax=Gigaspora margarita TaxID=4874 RepID=A0A8H4EQU0_GIGMA|nr:ATP-dependent DNA helicase pif1 [Gigaspora margarita]
MTDKSIDFLSHKTCNNCNKPKEIKEFFNDKEKVIDIGEFVYNLLISLENTNEFYEDDNVELAIEFNIELSSFINTILDRNNKKNFNNNEKLYLEIARRIAKFIEERDSYRWIYKDKYQKKFIGGHLSV